jgi:hypothetical protein
MRSELFHGPGAVVRRRLLCATVGTFALPNFTIMLSQAKGKTCFKFFSIFILIERVKLGRTVG